MQKLFIIDNDPVQHDQSQKIIKKNDLFNECTCYKKARTALDYLIAYKDSPEMLPDFILLNLNLPGLSAWDFLCVFEDLLPFLNKKIEVFIVTKSLNSSDKLHLKSYNFIRGFILRPMSSKVLLDILNRVTADSIRYYNLKMLGSLLTNSLSGLAITAANTLILANNANKLHVAGE